MDHLHSITEGESESISDSPSPSLSQRLTSLDALRGLVMLVMLLDHVRETIFLHQQVADPMDVTTTTAGLFFSRFLSSFCAPAFVFLAGISAWLYGQKHSQKDLSFFLLKRGAFLVILELLVIGTAWTGVFPPEKFYLQIIWCIGLCLICLAGLILLPRKILLGLAVLLIAGHNLLDGISFTQGSSAHFIWSILHDRQWIELFGVPARTTYPILPWIGVIALGYVIGPWFGPGCHMPERRRRLGLFAIALFTAFIVIRGLNVYGDSPWQMHDNGLLTFMGFLSLTKYPASLLFLLITLSGAAIFLRFFEKWPNHIAVTSLARFGGAALFFYILHLYILKGLYLIMVSIYGTNQGDYFGVNSIVIVWVWTALLVVPLWLITVWFANIKRKYRKYKWLSYL